MQEITSEFSKVQEEAHERDIKSIAKAFTPEEWDAVISLIPSAVLGEEMIKRATKGEVVSKKIQAIVEEEFVNEDGYKLRADNKGYELRRRLSV